MNKVFVLRHAKAGQYTSQDHERPLTETGLQQAHILGLWLKAQSIEFDLVLTSSSVRTIETVQNLELARGYSIVPDLYAAPLRVIEAVVRECSIDSGSILLVGHNPGISDLVQAAGHVDMMKTCEIVELQCATDFPSFSASECTLGLNYRPEV